MGKLAENRWIYNRDNNGKMIEGRVNFCCVIRFRYNFVFNLFHSENLEYSGKS
ncbi:MAG: hypothetical protein Q4C95_09785 [Planctomycetia bacterium]|nr:hypothetical protein [Planctomycetia bacterium]